MAVAGGIAALAAPVAASAHGFGRLYNLPVPFWLYAWGASAALLVSFLVAGYFMSAPSPSPPAAGRELGRAPQRLLTALKALSVFLLLLCIATGGFGTRDPYRNFRMTAFWSLFVLGFTDLPVLVGDVYASINPWRTLTAALGRFARGRFAYPEAVGDWPALALYVAFIGYELYNHGYPSGLATVLLGYTALNFAGVALIGAEAWFRHCEFFSVFLRLVALMAPLEWRNGSLKLRAPFSALARERPQHVSTVVFALFMLASTAFDGLRATQWWVGLFWGDQSSLGRLISGDRPVLSQAALLPWYIRWEVLWLVASPFLYFGLYLAALALAKALTRSARPLRELALDFGYTLLPIALVYNVTHYATLLLSQGPKIVVLVSDPFGWGWNLLGTGEWFHYPILPPLGFVWHAQVVLILLGHVISVCMAHAVALRVLPSRRQALLSQVPMLALMVGFTVAGLWILAQPLTELLMR